MTITLKHTLTGKTAEYPDHYLGHPVLGRSLELTDEEAHCVDCVVPEPEFIEEDEAIPTPSEVFGDYHQDVESEDDYTEQ